MRIVQFILLFTFIYPTVYSQIQRCHTDEFHKEKAKTNSQYQKAVNKFNLLIDQKQNQHTLLQKNTITIPVVVHVVYRLSSENISDAQVLSQIDVLNEDFARTNADASNTPSAFASLAANTDIQFCLATVDPNGNPTNGINRVQTSQSSFAGVSDNVKQSATGGVNAWDPNKYFNIWVCNLTGGILGYAELPSAGIQIPSTYGVVIGYKYFGRTGNIDQTYNKGRTTTHEIGHAFGLSHIWGDQYCGDDQISDTPPQVDPNGLCRSFPHNANNSCGADQNGEMYMNYMDYVPDGCMNLFTQGQSNRMNAVLSTSPYNQLPASTVCGNNNNGGGGNNGGNNNLAYDIGIASINNPSAGNLCASSIIPNISIQNFGTNTINSFQVLLTVDNGVPQPFTITGTLESNQIGSVDLNTLNLSSGIHTITISTAAPDGNTDQNTNNDSQTIQVNIQSSGMSLPIVENFTASLFPTSNWQIINTDNNRTWEKSQNVSAAYIDNYNYNAPEELDELSSPIIDFSSVNQGVIEFDLAYQMYQGNNGNYSDQLEVYVSSDCGENWNLVYQKSGLNLTTASIAAAQTAFVPTSNDWRKESIDISTYLPSSSLKVKFVNICNFANNLYIDNINIRSGILTDLLNVTASTYQIFPNPTTNGFNIISQSTSELYTLSIYNILGEKIKSIVLDKHQSFISTQDFVKGNYLVVGFGDDKQQLFTQKLFIH